jgi:hypothetical protein
MPTKRWFLFICIAALAALQPSLAHAQPAPGPAPTPFSPEFLLDVGYANISLGSNSSLNNQSALRIDPELSFAPLNPLPQLRVGIDVGISLVLDNSTRTLIIDNGQVIFHGSNNVPLWTLEPELNLSWRQTFGPGQQFFVEPGIAGGGMFGFLNLASSDPDQNSYSASSATGYGRVFLRVGQQIEGITWGFEGSWAGGGKMDFGANISGHMTQYYIGLFSALRF